MLDRGDIRFLGNVNYGRDLTLHDFRAFYDAVIFSTGAIKDADLDIPGIELEGSFGAADFVSWYDGHPDVPREWPLEAKEIAVIGNGNVALDVARMLVKHAEELLATEIPDNVYQGLKNSPGHGRPRVRPPRPGPGQVHAAGAARTEPHARDVDIVLYPEDFEFDEASDDAIRSNNQTKTMVNTLTNWLVEEHAEAEEPSSRRLHLHFLHSPVEIYEAGDGGPARWRASSSSGCSWTAPATSRARGSSSTTRCRPCTAPSATTAPRWTSWGTTPARRDSQRGRPRP